jgi:hypothetical protein
VLLLNCYDFLSYKEREGVRGRPTDRDQRATFQFSRGPPPSVFVFACPTHFFRSMTAKNLLLLLAEGNCLRFLNPLRLIVCERTFT